MTSGARSNGTLSELIQQAIRLVRRTQRVHLTQQGLTPRQAAVVLAITDRPGLSMGELAEHVGADPATLALIVAQLEEGDLLTRSAPAQDRRRSHLQPTTRALGLRAGIVAGHQAAEQALAGLLSAEQSTLLRELLRELLRRAEATR